MSFQYEGIDLAELERLWPKIASKLPPEISTKLKDRLETIFTSNGDAQTDELSAFVQVCCNTKPKNFNEYTSLIMLSVIFELIESPSLLFDSHKTQFMTHIFSTNTNQWCLDQEKVIAVAESIWAISSNASNINHIIIAIHNFNQFTFNVSMVLLNGALGRIAQPKAATLPLVEFCEIFEKIETLDIQKKSDKDILYEFLVLFQSFQKLASLPAARDQSLKELIHIQADQLSYFTQQMKGTAEALNKTIMHQVDLQDGTIMVHFIQFVLGSMDGLNSLTL